MIALCKNITQEATCLRLIGAYCILCWRIPVSAQLCAEDSDSPDLRDRAYLYWRLLSNDQMIEKLPSIILGAKPALVSHEYSLPRPLLEELLCNINTLASTYHRMPNSFSLVKTLSHEEAEVLGTGVGQGLLRGSGRKVDAIGFGLKPAVVGKFWWLQSYRRYSC